MNLLVMHETLDNYHHIQVPNMDKEISYILRFAHLRK